MSVRVAVVGVGSFGESHVRVLREHPMTELVAVADVDKPRAREMAERYDCRHYGSVEALLEEEPGLQAVTVATGEKQRAEVAIPCALAGKHLFLEKPLAATIADADRIVDAVDRAGVQAWVDFSLRYEPHYAEAHRVVREGQVGRPVYMYARRNGTVLGARILAPWTDLVTSTAIHELDLMLWYTGQAPQRVQAEGARTISREHGVDDVVVGTIRFADGSIGCIETHWLLQETHPFLLQSRFDLIGTEGSLHIDDLNTRFTIVGREGARHRDLAYWPIVRDRGAGCLREILHHFLASVAEPGSTPPGPGVREAREALRLAIAVREAARTGTPVVFEPAHTE